MSNLIAVILTDTHLKESNIETNKSIFKQAVQVLKKHESDLKKWFIYHGGDIFDSRKAQPLDVLKEGFLDILDYLFDEGVTLVAIPGNHDKTSYASANSFLDVYATHPSLILERYGACVHLDKECTLSMIPFFADEEYYQVLKDFQVEEGRKNFLLTHIGVDGAIMNNGLAVETNLSSNLFDRFDKVLIGHYHDEQEMNDKIHYIGSSIQHNFGEDDNKGVTLLYSDGKIERIPLDFPRYITREIDVKKLSMSDIKEMRENNENDSVRIILTGKEQDVKSFNKQQLLDLGVKVELKQTPIDIEELQTRVEPFTSKTLSESFKAFCKEKELNHKVGLKYFNKIDFSNV